MLTALARGAGVAFVLLVSSLGLKYLAQVVLAQWMGTVEYGIYEYVISWILLLAILAELGLPTAVVRFIPEYSVQEDWGRLRGLIRGSWQLILLAGFLLALGGVASILGLSTIRQWAYSTPMLVGIWMVPLVALAHLQSEMARAAGQITLAYAPFQVIWHLLVMLGAFVLFQQNQTLTSVPAITLSILGLLVVVLVQLWLLRGRWNQQVYCTPPIYKPREWLAVAFPLLLTAGFHILLSQIDILMIGAWVGPKAVGIYSVAAKTSIWASVVLQAVNTVAAPAFSALYVQGDRQSLQRLVSTVAHWIFWPSLMIALCLIGFAESILGIFGSEFVAARGEMTILVLGQLVNVGAGSVGYLMSMTGHQNQSAYIFGYSALLNVVLNAIAIPMLGTIGAAIATATTMAMWNIWLHILVVKYLGIAPSIVSTLAAKISSRR
ncbi:MULTISPECIES: oligosaccharide flippase family protein [unclassified Coleofasciculus]|uniref:oligosaccharide flippase family protein n=1 Tax=unclassified Coleofasciculus TaxID=2692782 RepID=UPI00187DE4B1|nr:MULTISPECIES: oligosaccharide flippase family protein [unclassified Coleofasciculus]MBE9126165.1 oligosaccharide flippase family protein [Coleofasciculus sp. LEGE 07081]MBE9149583.1 oligosaccharide flippase family protein [Coleofasciculus sp. LEGE 07092]